MTVIVGVGANVAVGKGSAFSGVAVGPQAASSASSESRSTAIEDRRLIVVPFLFTEFIKLITC